MAFEVPTRTQGEPAAYRRNSRFLPCIGLWPGQTGRSKIEDFRDHERLRLSDDPIGIRVIAVRTTAGSPPLVVRGRHLTDSVALHGTRGHEKTIAVGNPTPTVRGSWSSCPLDPRLFAPRFRHAVGTLVAHGKAGVCARISITHEACPRRSDSRLAPLKCGRYEVQSGTGNRYEVDIIDESALLKSSVADSLLRPC